jgi:SAM-dependent methyltransferase
VTTNYDDLYEQTRDALGKPSPKLVSLLQKILAPDATVLDVGCGQGRDAIWLAQAGHRVTGFDPSPVAIAQLGEVAQAAQLPILALVDRLETFATEEQFDCVLFDRTLHMLDAGPRNAGFARLLEAVRPGGIVVVLDEARNIPALRGTLDPDWQVIWTSKTGFAARRD